VTGKSDLLLAGKKEERRTVFPERERKPVGENWGKADEKWM